MNENKISKENEFFYICPMLNKECIGYKCVCCEERETGEVLEGDSGEIRVKDLWCKFFDINLTKKMK